MSEKNKCQIDTMVQMVMSEINVKSLSIAEVLTEKGLLEVGFKRDSINDTFLGAYATLNNKAIDTKITYRMAEAWIASQPEIKDVTNE